MCRVGKVSAYGFCLSHIQVLRSAAGSPRPLLHRVKGRDGRSHGSVRLGQDHSAADTRHIRPSGQRPSSHQRRQHRHPRRRPTGTVPQPTHRLHLPRQPSAAGVHRMGEHTAPSLHRLRCLPLGAYKRYAYRHDSHRAGNQYVRANRTMVQTTGRTMQYP